MKLTEKSNEIFEIVKNHDGRVSIGEICEITGRKASSVNANVNDLCSAKKGLCVREKEEVEGADKPVTYVVLTDAGRDFVPSED